MFAVVDVTGVDDLVASACSRTVAQVARDAQRAENRCAAAKVIAAGRLHQIRFDEIGAGSDGLGPQFGNIADKGATVDVATTLGVSTAKASSLIGLAVSLDGSPDLRAAFLAGDLDFYRAKMIASTIDTYTPELRKQLEAEALRLNAQASMSHRQLRDRLDELCIELDPEQAAHDRKAFAEQQDVRVRPDRHGHSEITGCVPAEVGKEFESRIAELVATLCAGDPRLIGQKRVAALAALGRGEAVLACHCGQDTCPSVDRDPSTETAATRALVVVHTDAATLAGYTGEMVPFMDGHGPIDPELARTLARDATWQGLYDDSLRPDNRFRAASGARRGRARPAGVTADPGPPAGALTYTPSQSLRDWIESHDGRCRFPWCDQPPTACEVDHQIPFDHTDPAAGGWTVRINLALLCVLHHHLKTAGLWHAHMHDDRSITWTHRDTGATMTTYPVR